MAHKPGTRKNVLIALDVEKYEQLQRLKKNTRVPMSEYLREAVDDLLKKYKKEMAK